MRLEQSGHIKMHSAPKVKDLKDAETNLELVGPFKYPVISLPPYTILCKPNLICLRQITPDTLYVQSVR